uniref:Uncharacterized protein n=1 Tax=Candidatus Kentrum sp. TC TaxID=2126339 RepID=A0A450ZYY6_9GAMM|nr:MAG: hypothetical protein BECKTC1821F_GA0114240_102822 [Candidatus Kentron sp. TC]
MSDIVPDTIKSDEQVAIEASETILTEKQEKRKETLKDLLSHEALISHKAPFRHASGQYGGSVVPSPDVVENRRKLLKDREAYVSLLIAEARKREAKLNKTARKAGYFAMGTKSVGILSGIASAVLVAASPANAATVAGLSALSSGSAAFQDTAVEIGLSTVVAEAQREALKAGANTAYIELANTPWEYLYSLAGYADQTDWSGEMKKLGAAIVKLEAAIRFTEFEIKITGTAKD